MTQAFGLLHHESFAAATRPNLSPGCSLAPGKASGAPNADGDGIFQVAAANRRTAQAAGIERMGFEVAHERRSDSG